MKKTVFLFIVLVLLSPWAGAQDVFSLRYILQNPQYFDQKKVVIIAEAVGEPLKAKKGYVWINVCDNGYNIGVFAPQSLAKKIKYWGGYKYTGDFLKIEGVFNSVCPQHGTRDIHAQNITIYKEGFLRSEDLPLSRRSFLIAFVIIYLTLSAVYLIRVKYAKRTGKNRKRSR